MVAPVFGSESHALNVSATLHPDPGEPPGTTAGNLLLCFSMSDTVAVDLPSGWTNLYTGTQDQLAYRVGYVVRGGSAVSTQFTYTNTASGTWAEVHVLRFVGTSATPISVSASGSTGNTSGHNPDPPSITIADSDTLVVAGGTTWPGANTWVAPSGYTMVSDLTAGNGCAVACKTQATPATVDPGAFSGTVTADPTNQYWDGFSIALLSVTAQDTPELYGRPDGLSGQRQLHQLLAQ